MKLVIISDTHTYHRTPKLPDGDVLIHCGDATSNGEMKTIKDMTMYFNELRNDRRFREIIFVPGNHDFCFDITRTRFDPAAQTMLESNGVHYLVDKAVIIDGFKFYGSPWVPNLSGWAFYDKGQDRWREAPTDIDVLITHGPALGILDRLLSGDHVGSADLLAYAARCPQLKLHAHGHIHEDRGLIRTHGRVVANAAICDRQYQPNGRAMEFEL